MTEEDLFQTPEARTFYQQCKSVQSTFQQERSIKLKPGQITDRRVLMGIEKNQKTPQEWHSFLTALKTPSGIIRQVFKNIDNANTLLFGIEELDHRPTLKIYLEYWDMLASLIQQGKHDRQPFALNRGYKWQVGSTDDWQEDIYWCYPLLTLPEMHKRLANIAGFNSPILKYLLEPLVSHSRYIQGKPLIYLEIASEHNPRRSFDINCYSGEFTVSDVLPYLLELAKHWNVQQDLHQRLSVFSQHCLGHISGGIGRDEQPFLTIYIEERPL
ncbi:hypothetical protein [Endozoicomonas ascidiicola]|uniref:hypothetical protein n=1 Tax=Endozoicomonas ascidiicola TaxID=1698521 RepID=UPI00082CD626|nr:hypothetical protein [Endozoicomonas ascidiicola]